MGMDLTGNTGTSFCVGPDWFVKSSVWCFCGVRQRAEDQ